MKRKNREKTNSSAKIFSGIFFLAGLAVLVLIGTSLGKEYYRKRQIQKEIDGLQAQIGQLGQQNGDMENLISYLSSTDFQDKQAREKLNLQKSDEKMIVLRKDVVEPNSQPQNDSLPIRKLRPKTILRTGKNGGNISSQTKSLK